MPLRPRALLRRPTLAVLLALAAGPAGAAEYRAVHNIRPGHVAWVYREPDVASPHIAYLRSSAMRVQTAGCRRLSSGGWCRVVVRGTRGWVQDRFLRAGGAVMRG